MNSEMIDVAEAHIVVGTVVSLTFSDGASRVLDLRPLMVGPIYEEIFEADSFDDFEVDEDAGTLVWSNGADIAPEILRFSGPEIVTSSPGAAEMLARFLATRMTAEATHLHRKLDTSIFKLTPNQSVSIKVWAGRSIRVPSSRSIEWSVVHGEHLGSLGSDSAREARVLT